jgi:sterol 3beta-glucosyltransferase
VKILLMSIGTRGDCEPFLGVGEMLRKYGENVICAFPEQYRGLAEESGFPFYSLGSEFLSLLNSDAGLKVMSGGSGGLQKIATTLKLAKQSMPIQKHLIDRQHEIIQKINPDCVVYHPKATYPLPWGLKTGRKTVILATVPCMIHTVKDRPTVGINKNLGKRINPLTYKLTNFATASAIMMAVKKFFPGEFTLGQIRREMLKAKIFYTVSPSIFPRPVYWGKNTMVAGFWERNKTVNWSPDAELINFIHQHKKILFITFGSMVNTDPAGKTKLFLDVLSECKIPTIINISGGGLMEPDNYDRSLIKFISSVPYDWIFPKMYAVIHHGGAGTTHSALKAGCATMAIPHTMDQPMWNDFIHALGAGPKGMSVNKLCKDNLKRKILDLYNNPSYKACAERIAQQMHHENHAEELYKFITG